jgi:hypothetical protein
MSDESTIKSAGCHDSDYSLSRVRPDPEKMKMLQAWEASNPEFHCTKPGEVEADDLLLDVHLVGFKSGYNAGQKVEAYEEMIAQAYHIEFTDYGLAIEKYGDENSKTGIVWQIVWQVEDAVGKRFSKHETALEAFKEIQEATKDDRRNEVSNHQ